MANYSKLTYSRELVFQFQFQFQFAEMAASSLTQSELKGRFAEFLEGIQPFSKADYDQEFAEKLLIGIHEHQEELKEELKKHLINWGLEKLDKIDLTLLLTSIYEMNNPGLFSTPPKVVINEYVNLAKKYGKQQSFSFINGILDSVKAAIKK